MKITIAQFNPLVGDVSGNCQKALALIDQARKDGAEWIIFPELSLVGYPPRDLLDYHQIFDENQKALEQIRKASTQIGVILGALSENSAPTGKRFFNTAFVFINGAEICSYYKRLLPSYDVFEDERYFERGSELGIFEHNGKQYGLAICEDVWNRPGFVDRLYDEDPVRDLRGKKLETLFVLSASPFDLKKKEKRERLLSEIGKELKTQVVYCNQVSGNDELIFDGGSAVANERGEIVFELPLFQDCHALYDSSQPKSLSANNLTEAECLFRALSFGVREYVEKSRQKKICLGLSGGIDSSVAAAVAVEAVGKENVVGVSLPTCFTSDASREDAKQLALSLGIQFREIDIDPLYKAFEKSLNSIAPTGLTLENIQPRIRMTVLMAISNQEKCLLLNTSNKSEIASGYSTLYGDSAGALAPLGDLLKRQVRDLAAFVNRDKEIVPLRVITRPPTAELRPNQKDEDSLPPYSVLDSLVETCVTQHLAGDELQKKGFSKNELTLFSKLHAISEFKRRQNPPILRVSTKAFGLGRRIPLAARHYTDK